MVTDSRLLTIGEFARASGLTASALRFYADSGLLTPAVVDPGSGYRYYDESRLDRAVTIRELREIGMSLGIIAEVLESGAARAARPPKTKHSLSELEARRLAPCRPVQEHSPTA